MVTIGLSHKKTNETGEGVDCGHMTVLHFCILWIKPLEFPKQSVVELYKIVSPHDSICYGYDATGIFQRKSKPGGVEDTTLFWKSPLDI